MANKIHLCAVIFADHVFSYRKMQFLLEVVRSNTQKLYTAYSPWGNFSWPQKLWNFSAFIKNIYFLCIAFYMGMHFFGFARSVTRSPKYVVKLWLGGFFQDQGFCGQADWKTTLLLWIFLSKRTGLQYLLQTRGILIERSCSVRPLAEVKDILLHRTSLLLTEPNPGNIGCDCRPGT